MLPENLKHAIQYCTVNVSPVESVVCKPLIIFTSYYATGEGSRRGVYVYPFHIKPESTAETIYEDVHNKIIQTGGQSSYFMQYPDAIMDIDYVMQAYSDNNETIVKLFESIPQNVRELLIRKYNNLESGFITMSFWMELFLVL